MARKAAQRRHRGYALMLALVLLLLVSMGTLLAVERAQLLGQREKEAQLLWAGDQYRRAIGSYLQYAPVGRNELPRTLEDLLEDRRGAELRRHLRRIYEDPMTGRIDWVVERQGDRIIGVRSSSGAMPLRRVGFSPADANFGSARTYRDWLFAAVVADGANPAAGAAPPAQGQPPTVPAPGSPLPPSSGTPLPQVPPPSGPGAGPDRPSSPEPPSPPPAGDESPEQIAARCEALFGAATMNRACGRLRLGTPELAACRARYLAQLQECQRQR